MSTKAFFWLVIVTLVVGVGIGAVIVFVVALGDGEADRASQTSLSAPSTSRTLPQAPGQPGQQSLDQIREGTQPGEASPGELGQLRQQPQSQAGQGGLGSGAIGEDRLMGTIEMIEGNVVTLNTPQGLFQAITAADTTIRMFSQGTAADLEAGIRVTVNGQRAEDGTVEARSISILPEGTEGFFGPGFAGRLGQNPDGQNQFAQLRQRIQSGEITQGELAELRQQAQRRFGQGSFGGDGQRVPGGGGLGGGLAGRASLTGTIDKIDGATVTVNTPQGPLEINVDEETIIQTFAEGTLEDLQAGMRVTVIGQSNEDGKILARSILMVPERFGSFQEGGAIGR